MKICPGDLDDMAGYVAGEANHAKSERTEKILGVSSRSFSRLCQAMRPSNRWHVGLRHIFPRWPHW